MTAANLSATTVATTGPTVQTITSPNSVSDSRSSGLLSAGTETLGVIDTVGMGVDFDANVAKPNSGDNGSISSSHSESVISCANTIANQQPYHPSGGDSAYRTNSSLKPKIQRIVQPSGASGLIAPTGGRTDGK
uniref:Uncharacterized protein n=1 Tax=Anopheles maculatus TaxID=74869 RepID=A0A182SY56_9DIPT